MKLVSKLGVFAVALLILAFPAWKTYQAFRHELPAFGLLIPEGAEQELGTRVWLRAALEEGVPLELITEERLSETFQASADVPRAILIPDEVAQNASTTLIALLENYVNTGGKLVLVSDALMHELNGRMKESFPTENYFHFPAISGRIGDTAQLRSSPLLFTDEWIQKLQIPPGQYSPPYPEKARLRELCTYQSAHPLYPHWPNDAKLFSGTKLAEASDGSLIAGIQKIGLGQVLWINLPLSYLKRRTDGLLMHSFLRWISEDWVGLPRLLPVPNGVGGMVLNLHIDSNAALPYLKILKEKRFFEDGPFSIHVTAGPDARAARDGLGFNLPNNRDSQEWVRYWTKLGHEVGSHGGWIHDYFATHVPDRETPEFAGYLEKNFKSIRKFAAHGPLEYSAPMGNHPIWINRWLRKFGYHAYYVVGDNGMGPTQNFRDDEFTDEGLWSFPVASFRQIASFEEANDHHVPSTQLFYWLKALSEFVEKNQVARLFYFHPPGIQFYEGTLFSWMHFNATLAKAGHFRWYTMENLAKFLTRRESLHWQIHEQADHFLDLEVGSHLDLHEMVWRVSKNAVKEVQVLSGKVRIKEIGNEIEIQPENDQGMHLRYQEVQNVF